MDSPARSLVREYVRAGGFEACGLSAHITPSAMESSKKRKDSAPQEAASAPQDVKRRPIHTIRVDDVSASIWSRDVLIQGEPRKFFSVSVERSYVDKTGTRRWTS